MHRICRRESVFQAFEAMDGRTELHGRTCACLKNRLPETY